MSSASSHKLCMIPGPIEFHEQVLGAMGTPATAHTDPGFIKVFSETIKMLREVVVTTSGQPFVIAGSGTLGWDQTAANLVEAGENVLVLSNGYFGDGLADCLSTYGANVTVHRPEIGTRTSTEKVEELLKAKNYKLITVTQVDTSTGVLDDVEAVCNVVKRVSPNTLVAVDGVCATAAETLYFDKWGVDVVITASQKALGCPPGISVVVASQKALGVLKTRKTPVPAYYINWNRWLPVMQAYENLTPSYFATPCVQTIFALHASLKQITAMGMESYFARHRETAQKVRAAVKSWGLKTVAQSPEITSHAMTAIWLPENVTLPDLLPRLAARGVVTAGGIHKEIAKKYFRIGHMGISATENNRQYIEKTLKAVEESLEEAGYKFFRTK
ncbi:hypothetical protein H4219_001293 [Mycoemilia scoparia]|uniref:alanine--glyoxylate transaminase n=1 Tax=Mycoemilia scoparia TaxID=417184 RepID=A0A9W8A1C7_9FUNG|nr:hypothetical protein H4219_001293 [Mycoemilia scoparia]